MRTFVFKENRNENLSCYYVQKPILSHSLPPGRQTLESLGLIGLITMYFEVEFECSPLESHLTRWSDPIKFYPHLPSHTNKITHFNTWGMGCLDFISPVFIPDAEKLCYSMHKVSSNSTILVPRFQSQTQQSQEPI